VVYRIVEDDDIEPYAMALERLQRRGAKPDVVDAEACGELRERAANSRSAATAFGIQTNDMTSAHNARIETQQPVATSDVQDRLAD
jgi:hypothetical protein